MSLATLMVDDVEIVHPATVVDAYGNSTKDYGAAATLVESKAWVAQEDADELISTGDGQGRTGEVSTWRIFLPAGTALSADDRVRCPAVVAGDLYVVGQPNPAKTPRGAHHIEARLRLVVG